MSKLSFATLLIAALTAAALASADGLRAQGSNQIEYLRVASYGVREERSSGIVFMRIGYQACLATTAEWTCRRFAPTGSPDGALRTMLATLGSEGWELVSVFDEASASGGMTYLFKRQLRVMP